MILTGHCRLSEQLTGKETWWKCAGRLKVRLPKRKWINLLFRKKTILALWSASCATVQIRKRNSLVISSPISNYIQDSLRFTSYLEMKVSVTAAWPNG